MQEVKFQELKKEYQNLLNHAEKAMETAYSPYSNFKVGAALLTEKKEIVTGSNMENATWGATICA